MKKIKFLLLSLLMFFSVTLVACAGDSDFAIDAEKASAPNYTSATILTLNNSTVDYSSITDRGNAIISRYSSSENKYYYSVYSLLENKTVYPEVEDRPVLYSTDVADYVQVQVTASMHNVYKLDGNNTVALYQATNVYGIYSYKFGDAVYEEWEYQLSGSDEITYKIKKFVNGQEVEFNTELPETGKVGMENVSSAMEMLGPEFDDKYFATSVLANGNIELTVYNKEGKEKDRFTIDNKYFTQIQCPPVFLGKFMISQVVEELPEDAEKYDYINNDVKYDVETVKINLLNGKVKKFKIDYLLTDVEYDMEHDYVAAEAMKIEDKKLVPSGNILFDVNANVKELKYNYTSYKKLNDNRFVATGRDGADSRITHIIDEKYNLVCDLSAYSISNYGNSVLVLSNSEEYVMIDFDGNIKTRLIKQDTQNFTILYQGLNNDVMLFVEIDRNYTDDIGYPGKNLTRSVVYGINKDGVTRMVAEAISDDDNGGVALSKKYGLETYATITFHSFGYTISKKYEEDNTIKYTYDIYTGDGVLLATVSNQSYATPNVNVRTFGEEDQYLLATINSGKAVLCIK